MESFEEFRKNVMKFDKPRLHRIRNSLGVYDAFKYYRKHRPDDKKFVLTESQYFAIIRQINNILVKHIVKGDPVKLPYRMGTIELRKYKGSIKLDEHGKVVTNLPVDWDGTLKLWYEDEESYRNKTLLRINEKEIYKIYWNKEDSNFNNRCFYEIKFNKELKAELKYNIRTGIMKDACIFKDYNYVE